MVAKNIIMFFLVLLLSACAVTEMEITQASTKPVRMPIRTKSVVGELSREDSLRMVYEIQTDREGFLVRHICQEDGEWVIRISRENALSLGIGADTYDFYQAYVNRLNVE